MQLKIENFNHTKSLFQNMHFSMQMKIQKINRHNSPSTERGPSTCVSCSPQKAVCQKSARYYTPIGQDIRNHVLARFGAQTPPLAAARSPQHSTVSGPRGVTVGNMVSIAWSWPLPSHTNQNIKSPNSHQRRQGDPPNMRQLLSTGSRIPKISLPFGQDTRNHL